MSESPDEEIRRAAALMRKRASEATPGPWERPLDIRHKDLVGAALPDDEEPRKWADGIIPGYMTGGYTGRYIGQRERVGVVHCNTWSDGTHDRKRNGRDLEFIAAMHPLVALAVADWLDAEAEHAEICARAVPYLGTGTRTSRALTVARAYLGDTTMTAGEGD